MAGKWGLLSQVRVFIVGVRMLLRHVRGQGLFWVIYGSLVTDVGRVT